jgi:putative PEP-CTERM system histidine kinase
MDNALRTAALWSYGIAAAGFVAFAARLALGTRGGVRARVLLSAIFASALWAAAAVAFVLWPAAGTWRTCAAFDACRYGLWFAFAWSVLRGNEDRKGAPPLPGWFMLTVVAGLVASVILAEARPFAPTPTAHAYDWTYIACLGLAVAGLLIVEQIFRRATPQARWAVRPLCIALAAMFAFDLWMYADALLLGRLDGEMWVTRGIANALVLPLFAVATARNPLWTIEMHMSRQVVFHSTALLVSAGFLLAVAAAGFVMRIIGGEWTRALQIVLVFAALVTLTFVASSGGGRAKLRVFVNKHFFSYRYDYRHEWLRFTRSLSTENSLQGVQQRAITALGDLVESPGGAMWLVDGDAYLPSARCNTTAVDAIEPADTPFINFLANTGWIIDLKEFATHPERYRDLIIPAWLSGLASAWLVIPLESSTGLAGFVVLMNPRTPFEVNWEVLDVLKTASRQAAGYVGYVRATESLLEARKFDAFNRMSAFVVHDLRNLVAQLSLMLKNAERHRDNPEFQRDMLATVEHVVGRMYKLMLQLRIGSQPPDQPQVTELAPIVRRVCAEKSGAGAAIDLDLAPEVLTIAHEDRLDHVVGHLVQNAIEATEERGRVSVRVAREGAWAMIEVSDTGIGMHPDFVRDRLFKPFETTKAGGMGIGIYESEQYVSALGGRIEVDSTPDVGTRVRILLPVAEGAAGSPAAREAA